MLVKTMSRLATVNQIYQRTYRSFMFIVSPSLPKDVKVITSMDTEAQTPYIHFTLLLITEQEWMGSILTLNYHEEGGLVVNKVNLTKQIVLKHTHTHTKLIHSMHSVSKWLSVLDTFCNSCFSGAQLDQEVNKLFLVFKTASSESHILRLCC